MNQRCRQLEISELTKMEANMTTVGSITSSSTQNTSATSNIQKTADKEINALIKKIRSLSSSSYEIDQALEKIDTDKIDGKQILRLQNAFNERQKISDLFSNMMRSLHEMSMNVVRNMKLN